MTRLDSLAQASLSLVRPLVQDRTQYFVAADATWQDRAAAIPCVDPGRMVQLQVRFSF